MGAKIIALGHQKKVGKDEFTKYCIDYLRPKSIFKSIVRRGFADKLYDFCYSIYEWAGFKPRQYYQENPDAKEVILPKIGKSPRTILIEIGNHMRAYDLGVWINAALSTVNCDLLFITDCRYPNELEAVRKVGGHTVKMIRPGLPIPTDIADTALNDYDFDETINNSAGKRELYDQAKYFCETRILGN